MEATSNVKALFDGGRFIGLYPPGQERQLATKALDMKEARILEGPLRPFDVIPEIRFKGEPKAPATAKAAPAKADKGKKTKTAAAPAKKKRRFLRCVVPGCKKKGKAGRGKGQCVDHFIPKAAAAANHKPPEAPAGEAKE